jgi:hypothetical protein
MFFFRGCSCVYDSETHANAQKTFIAALGAAHFNPDVYHNGLNGGNGSVVVVVVAKSDHILVRAPAKPRDQHGKEQQSNSCI